MVTGIRIEQALNDVLQEADLQHYRKQICFDLQLRKLEHFDYVKDRELESRGISLPSIRRLRAGIVEKKKLLKKHPEIVGRTVAISLDDPIPRQSTSGTNALIEKDQIKLMENLGEGTFAIVKRAFWSAPDGRRLDVAVKILRDASPLVMEELQREASSLLKLQHPNLIRLYGVVNSMPWMVFELCEGGSLLDRLRDKNKQALLVTQLLDYCQQIAKGMTYLEAKHCVHRDLATRNVLLSNDEKTVKICDFGLMRSLEENERMYIMSPQKRVPFAWCPPESLRRREFSHASDVWAMGVLMWEIFTYGEDPWVGCKGIDVLEKVEKGERLPKPKFSSQQIYDLMLLCWKAHPDHRPKFKLLWGFIKECTVSVVDVRESHQAEKDEQLSLVVGDKVLVIDNVGVTWFGQSERTRCFGTFFRSCVFVRAKTEARPEQQGSSKISRPITGSFIHTGHGDVRGGQSWGQPERIDEIYLRNPVTGKPVDSGFPVVVPSITTLNSGATKIKPQLPSKPPAVTATKPHTANGVSTSTTDSLQLSRATAHMAPPSIVVNDRLNNVMQVPSTSSSVTMRVAPPPPSKNQLPFAAVPRPLSSTQRSSPETVSRSANSTPPAVTAESFLSKTELASQLQRKLSAAQRPSTSYNAGPTPAIPTSAPVKSLPTVGHGAHVLGELQRKLQDGSSNQPKANGDFVRLRPQNNMHETPLLVHSQMSTIKGANAAYTLGPDPFEVSSAIKSIVQQDRYSSVLEKRSNSQQPIIQHQQRPVSAQHPQTLLSEKPHSSSTPQLGSQLLQPTPASSSARVTTSPQHVSPSVQQMQAQQQMFNQQQHQQQELLRQRQMQQQREAAVRNAAIHALNRQQKQQEEELQRQQQMHIMQQLRQQTETERQQDLLKRHELQKKQETERQQLLLKQQQEMIIQREQQAKLEQQKSKIASTAVVPGVSITQSHNSDLTSTTSTATNQLTQPKQVALPPTQPLDRTVFSTVATTLPRQAALTSAANSDAGSQSGANTTPSAGTNNRASIVEAVLAGQYRPSSGVDVSSLLPPPSALFYGGSSPGSPSSGSHFFVAPTTPSVVASTVPQNSAATTFINTAVSNPNPPTANPSAPTSSRLSTSALTPTPLVLPSQPLIPTPLYPSLATPSLVPSLPVAANKPQSPVLVPVPAQPSMQTLPLFSAQNSLGGYPSRNPSLVNGAWQPAYNQNRLSYNAYPNNYSSYNNSYGFGYSSAYPSSSFTSSMLPPLIPELQIRPTSSVIHSDDVILSFDPLSSTNSNLSTSRSERSVPASIARSSTTPHNAPAESSSVSRAEQMEVLYKEAFFSDRSQCDQMVGRCNGDVEKALKHLKMNYLVDMGIARDLTQALSALENKGWNLNSAAETILS